MKPSTRIKLNLPELRERLQQRQQVLSRIERHWQELEERLTELESRLPVLPEVPARDEETPRKPR